MRNSISLTLHQMLLGLSLKENKRVEVGGLGNTQDINKRDTGH
jgi:hypothetical protein